MKKKSLKEEMVRIEQKQNDWFEPMKEWIKVATNLVKIARDSDLQEKKAAAKEIFDLNLHLASRAVRNKPCSRSLPRFVRLSQSAKFLKV